MTRQTMLKILTLLVINYSLLVNLQAQSWQFSKKLGCDKKYTPNDVPTDAHLTDQAPAAHLYKGPGIHWQDADHARPN